MKPHHFFGPVIMTLAIVTISFTACKKDKIDNGNNDPASLVQLSTDENNMEAVTDDVMNDMEGVLASGNMKSTESLPCNATIDSTSVMNDTITIHITYNGLNCNGTRTRTGVVEIRKRVGTHWGQQGAAVNFRYLNFMVTKVATQKSIILNGSKTYENVSGGFVWQVGNAITSLVKKVHGTMSITFDNGTSRTWNVARQLTYSGSQGALLLTIDGFGSAGGYSNLVTWGINRHGEDFFTQINESVVHKQACGWDPISGIKVHQIPGKSKTATITFGYNSNNEPITEGECPTRYRIDWTNGTHSGTEYLELP